MQVVFLGFFFLFQVTVNYDFSYDSDRFSLLGIDSMLGALFDSVLELVLSVAKGYIYIKYVGAVAN